MTEDNVVHMDTVVARSPREALEPQDIVPPVKRSARARGGMVRFFNFLMTLALFGAITFVGIIWYGKTEFEAPGPLAESTTFTVPKGATFASIVPGLEAKNIIKKQGPLRVFTRGVRAAGQGSALKAGEFAFTPGMSMRAVMQQLTEGRAIEYSITFPEGWTSFRIMERIAANEELEGDVPPIPPEGTLLPNTYNFQRGDTRESIVSKLKEGQKKALREIWHSRAPDLPLRSQEELVILASIIEKETGVASERRHVASVFVNRLRKGMRLQTDPTVIYGIWGGRGKPKDRGGLRRSELDKKTPYNTYQINGLPPGPIANPGIESLRAAANPLETDDLFFVADGTGGHVFAKTLKEHNANVSNWRAIERQRKKEAEAKAKELADGVTAPATQDN
ncbi:MAG: endolytic transglycosylase MltG [Rhizobiaceae bacterium]|nr:endolytic transglycosylase MltG [Hyphomicrobiales bacterium]NRB30141.1 endolytic transglycosylase MltG [Rhizobiaceae bacterium]